MNAAPRLRTRVSGELPPVDAIECFTAKGVKGKYVPYQLAEARPGFQGKIGRLPGTDRVGAWLFSAGAYRKVAELASFPEAYSRLVQAYDSSSKAR